MSESHPPHEAADAPDTEGSTDVAGAEEPEFTNRAARRAKSASSGKPQTFTKGKAPVGRGAVQSPRQYGTRRSG
jgi:hypothetical protein